MLKQGVEVTLSRGLEQWLWFLGLDVRHPEGNLLTRHGFRKFKPQRSKGSSRYQREWHGDLIDLHSFFVGVYPKNADGFIFIRARYQCFIYTAPHPPCPGNYPEDFIFTTNTDESIRRFHAAAARFLGWLEEYEQWLDYTCGPDYRTSCYKAYHLKWQPPSKGRNWFSWFREQPNYAEPVKPVEAHMKLLETDAE